MAVTLKASAVPSTSASWPLSFQLDGYSGDIIFSVVTGISSGPPATYGSLSDPVERTYSQQSPLNIVRAGSSYIFSGSCSIAGYPSGDFGLNLWVCIFVPFGPGSGSVPVAIAGPFVVGP
jgi:hypothetical protein